MQDTGKELKLENGFKVDIFGMWEFILVEQNITYPGYEISFAKNKVYLSSDTNISNIKKIILNVAKEICQINYGGGRENPFIEWLSRNADIHIISK